MHPGNNRARFYALGKKIFQVSWCLGCSVAEEVSLQGKGQLVPRTAAVTKICLIPNNQLYHALKIHRAS